LLEFDRRGQGQSFGNFGKGRVTAFLLREDRSKSGKTMHDA